LKKQGNFGGYTISFAYSFRQDNRIDNPLGTPKANSFLFILHYPVNPVKNTNSYTTKLTGSTQISSRVRRVKLWAANGGFGLILAMAVAFEKDGKNF